MFSLNSDWFQRRDDQGAQQPLSGYSPAAAAGERLKRDVRPQDMKKTVSLYRYYLMMIWMRHHYRIALGTVPWLERMHQAPKFAGYLLTVDQPAIYMALWYGMLYVVVEGWKRLGLSDPKVDTLLSSHNTELLKHYRNGTFHFHEGLVSPICEKILMAPDQTKWTDDLTDSFKAYFDRQKETREFMQAAKTMP